MLAAPAMPSGISSRRVVVVSFLVDVLDVVTNLVVAILTGSAVRGRVDRHSDLDTILYLSRPHERETFEDLIRGESIPAFISGGAG